MCSRLLVRSGAVRISPEMLREAKGSAVADSDSRVDWIVVRL